MICQEILRPNRSMKNGMKDLSLAMPTIGVLIASATFKKKALKFKK